MSNDFCFSSEIDACADTDLSFDVCNDFESDLCVDYYIESDLCLDGNVAMLSVNADAIGDCGDETFVEVTADVLTLEGEMSHVCLTVVSAVD